MNKIEAPIWFGITLVILIALFVYALGGLIDAKIENNEAQAKSLGATTSPQNVAVPLDMEYPTQPMGDALQPAMGAYYWQPTANPQQTAIQWEME